MAARRPPPPSQQHHTPDSRTAKRRRRPGEPAGPLFQQHHTMYCRTAKGRGKTRKPGGAAVPTISCNEPLTAFRTLERKIMSSVIVPKRQVPTSHSNAGEHATRSKADQQGWSGMHTSNAKDSGRLHTSRAVVQQRSKGRVVKSFRGAVSWNLTCR